MQVHLTASAWQPQLITAGLARLPTIGDDGQKDADLEATKKTKMKQSSKKTQNPKGAGASLNAHLQHVIRPTSLDPVLS